MKSLSIREMRGALTELDEMLRHQHEILITRRGKPIAKLVSLEIPRRPPSQKRLRDLTPPMGVPSEDLVREDREGR